MGTLRYPCAYINERSVLEERHFLGAPHPHFCSGKTLILALVSGNHGDSVQLVATKMHARRSPLPSIFNCF